MTTKPVVQDQKKRALEALERRFAVAKAEAQNQLVREKRKRGERCSNPVPTSVGPSAKASPISLSNNASKKDLDSEGFTYSCISQPVNGNLLSTTKKCDDDKTTVDKILHDLLQKGDAAQKYIQGSKSVKLDNWILLDNFVQGKNTSVSHLRENSKRSKKHMSMKKLKKCGVLDLPEELHKFDLFMPMHELWKDYVMKLLKNIGKNNVAQALLGADLHGAILRVVESKVDSFIGVVGIMVRETAETFGIITQENKFRVVPKRNSIFVYQADCWRITLHGNKCISRTMDTT